MPPRAGDADMITHVRLKNFKAYRDSKRVDFAPLTVIVGCNNSGKSSLLHAILCLKQTLLDPSTSARLVTRGRLVDLGGFYDMLHGGEEASRKRISIEIGRDPLDTRVRSPDHVNFRESTCMNLSFSLSEAENRIRLAKLVLSDNEGPVLECGESGKWSVTGLSDEQAKILKVQLNNFLPSPRLVLEKKRKTADLPETGIDAYMTVNYQAQPWSHLLESVEHIAPLRAHIPFYGGMGVRASSELGPGGENVLRVLANTEPLPANSKCLLESVNEWMSGPFAALSGINLKKLDQAGNVRSLLGRDPGSEIDVNIAGMGEGISQVLPIVCAVLGSPPYSNLLIEQPEIHLHPRLQARLADLFVDVVNRGKRQLIVETHSEHLLLRLRTRVASGDIPSEKVSIIYVEKTNGQSTARRLALNGRGHFDDWPKGFFDEGYQEAMALSRAASKSGNGKRK